MAAFPALKMRINVVIADPSESIRFGLRTLLESDGGIEVVGEAPLASETLSLVQKLKPSVLLLEWRMPDAPASELLPKIGQFAPMTKIVIVSTWNEAEFDVPLKHRDLVAGYVWKHESEHLLKAIREVIAGRSFISPLLGRTLRRNSKKSRRTRS